MAKPTTSPSPAPHDDVDADRRDLLINATIGMGVAGAACCAVPFVASMAPSRDVQAQATVDIKLTDIAEGESKTVLWQGKPVFIWHRNAAQIAEAKAGDPGSGSGTSATIDPQKDGERVKKDQWLIVMGVCTHLGCVPMRGGDFGGWRCPCHGSQFDDSGRVRHGPAGMNLPVPPYAFLDDETVRIG